MAKQKKEALSLTPAQTATVRAERIKGMRVEIENMKADLDILVDEQVTYMKENNLTETDGLKLIETSGKTTFDGLTGKALTVAKERLISMIGEVYIKKSLDEAKIFASLDSDDALFGQLTKVGLKTKKSESSLSLREVK